MQAEADRRVTQALSKQQKEYEKKLSLSALDEQERAMAEKDLRIQELEERLRENAALINKQEVVKTLASRGLPRSLRRTSSTSAPICPRHRRSSKRWTPAPQSRGG